MDPEFSGEEKKYAVYLTKRELLIVNEALCQWLTDKKAYDSWKEERGKHIPEDRVYEMTLPLYEVMDDELRYINDAWFAAWRQHEESYRVELWCSTRLPLTERLKGPRVKYPLAASDIDEEIVSTRVVIGRDPSLVQ